MGLFELVSPFQPAGDQPQAIEALTHAMHEGRKEQVLMGVSSAGIQHLHTLTTPVALHDPATGEGGQGPASPPSTFAEQLRTMMRARP